MKLYQQVPDASRQMKQLNQKNSKRKIGSPSERNVNVNRFDLYCDNIFTKWPTKLALIIVVGLSKLF
jgi:hypothetical protein